MTPKATLVVLIASLPLWSAMPGCAQDSTPQHLLPLPEVRLDGTVSVERSLAQRRSVRSFTGAPLSLEDLAQVLWAAQGITEPVEEAPPGFSWPWMGGLRTAPSAGALYPLELYAVVSRVEGVRPGLYRYVPTAHALEPVTEGDLRDTLADGALRQTAILEAPVSLVFAAVVDRTAAKYGDRAERYVQMEVGAAAQNVYLQCESLDLGTVFTGAFHDDDVKEALTLPDDQRVFAILPVGRPAGDGGR